MKRLIPAVLFICCIQTTLFPAPITAYRDKELVAKENERDVLKRYVESSRDSLQLLTVEYYAIKQRGVDQREADKEEFDRLNGQRENRTTQLSRIREEILSREQSLQEARSNLSQKQEEAKIITATISDVLKKESDAIIGTFPTNREVLRRKLEAVRIPDGAPDIALRNYSLYKLENINHGLTIDLSRQRILLDEGSPVDMTIARIGAVQGFGIDSAGTYYMIRQTGRFGAARYTIDPITSSEFINALSIAFPKWLSDNAVSGEIPIDVMQNDQSSALVTGEKSNLTAATVKFFKGGGPVMLPLALITLWAIIIVVMKLVTLAQKHKNDSKFFKKIIDLIDNKDIDTATRLAVSQRGVVARVAHACLKNSKWSRESAEKSIREILVEEVPILGKHLNTLAVIAAAAPLLGLLGTVTGMINVFEVITNYGTGDPKILAGGISEALITTEVGLIIAVPVVLLHNYIRNRKDDIQAEMERHAIGIINRLWP
jgi:biopolymer transport protein ExbB